ncbi:SDR family oxidoreductase [Massilia antarctica]|uniref:SDR family oxidoreductase n=1 Tax=Massilia antarctica TaxID=2765360 RepID=A0AA48WC06_9BURK|nr:SDR family oxidoreductase [Massilia antarctica]QPI48749.1 SDR family oxidoreductase [Massilia antarctica]
MRKTILITGCSSGIGRAAAELFAERGWNVVATMRDPSTAGALAAAPNVVVTRLDVTDRASIDTAVALALASFGRIDAVVNNAGFGAFGPFETASTQLIDRQLATNVTGVFDVVRAVLPAMREQRAGTIINVASVGGLTTMPLNAIYHATKYAIVGFTEGLTYELAPFGIAAKVVAPGGVATDFAGRSLSKTFSGDAHPYADSVAKVMHTFENNRGGFSQPRAIAEVIFSAATDGSAQVTYVAGADADALLAARAKLGTEAYIDMMNQRFGLK